MSRPLAARAVRLRPNVVFRSLVAETVLLDLETGDCCSLDPAAGRMLEAMVAAPSVGDAAAALVQQGLGELDEVLRDLRAVYDVLSELRLVCRVPAVARPARGRVSAPSPALGLG